MHQCFYEMLGVPEIEGSTAFRKRFFKHAISCADISHGDEEWAKVLRDIYKAYTQAVASPSSLLAPPCSFPRLSFSIGRLWFDICETDLDTASCLVASRWFGGSILRLRQGTQLSRIIFGVEYQDCLQPGGRIFRRSYMV
ncbi:unnamed protein product [Prorocentrum cordatum]|uniref:Uncharacterized protein n=1 Tax=Prorocentrum cordatum TaxID=2364126 RepID=A0ABN9WA04_9DINO|nr:unnamed protein product [Polarella glacialis]